MPTFYSGDGALPCALEWKYELRRASEPPVGETLVSLCTCQSPRSLYTSSRHRRVVWWFLGIMNFHEWFSSSIFVLPQNSGVNKWHLQSQHGLAHSNHAHRHEHTGAVGELVPCSLAATGQETWRPFIRFCFIFFLLCFSFRSSILSIVTWKHNRRRQEKVYPWAVNVSSLVLYFASFSMEACTGCSLYYKSFLLPRWMPPAGSVLSQLSKCLWTGKLLTLTAAHTLYNTVAVCHLARCTQRRLMSFFEMLICFGLTGGL